MKKKLRNFNFCKKENVIKAVVMLKGKSEKL